MWAEVRQNRQNMEFFVFVTGPKIAKIGNFWYKFSARGYIPLSNFYKVWPGEGVPGPHLYAIFHRYDVKNAALQPRNCQKW